MTKKCAKCDKKILTGEEKIFCQSEGEEKNKKAKA